MCKKLIIIGAGGHGKVVANIATLNGYKEIYFLDDDTSKKYIGKYQIIGTTKDIDRYKNEYDFFIAIGNNQIRKKISILLLDNNIKPVSLIHPSAVIDDTVQIGYGVVIMANAVINADTMIGNNVIVNTASSIDHDCIINDYVHISPGVHIAGNVHIGEKTWLCIGSIIVNNITIGSNIIVGAGTTVIDNINNAGKYVGLPLRKIG